MAIEIAQGIEDLDQTIIGVVGESLDVSERVGRRQPVPPVIGRVGGCLAVDRSVLYIAAIVVMKEADNSVAVGDRCRVGRAVVAEYRRVAGRIDEADKAAIRVVFVGPLRVALGIDGPGEEMVRIVFILRDIADPVGHRYQIPGPVIGVCDRLAQRVGDRRDAPRTVARERDRST